MPLASPPYEQEEHMPYQVLFHTDAGVTTPVGLTHESVDVAYDLACSLQAQGVHAYVIEWEGGC